ncbi:MED6-domain-containing protein [Athelia psychrophila]|uniref:Mediator of RNA polymerase II transcription subunit 6 n=1 Tax=Athelia psychrophila TaxID=1759441 RepID=A0A166V0U6_9AGAM|nr:MED6-domain-containing protein [Fibularhizoctonia sp. CBS 109695]
MDINDLHPPDDYSHRFFIWHEWIQANGQLTNENVFDYFATSMFYDKQSNNQVLRMQTMHTGMPIANEAEELRRFVGIEFAVVHAQPPTMFIIHKRERLSPDEVRPLAAYFIMNNRIYQSPDVYTVVSNRLLTSLYSLQSSLDILRTHRPDYTPRTGFVWPIMDPQLAEDTSKKRVADEELPSTSEPAAGSVPKPKVASTLHNSKKQQNNLLLLHAMKTTAMHSNTTFSSRALELAAENSLKEVNQNSTGARSSITPGPTVGTTPKGVSNAPTPQEPPAKGPTGAGKKKRKSEHPSV